MDNTEVHYLTYDPEEIWKTMMTNYVEAGGDILYPGDEKEIELRSVQADIVQVFAGVDNALRMNTLRYAQGQYLDVYGERRLCERIKASAAHATVTITTNATGKSDVIAAGTAITSDGQMFYLLADDLELNGYQQTITAEIIADRTGSIGNGLLAGTEMVMAVTRESVNKIVVSTSAIGGNDQEEDEVYRERIRTFGLASVTTGPSQQYESIAKGVSSEIIDAKALNIGGGRVGVYLILEHAETSDSIMRQVLEAMSARTVRPLTDLPSVFKATDIPYTLNMHYSCDNSAQTIAAISEAVKEYQNLQDNSIGMAFNPDRLMSMVYQAGATRVFWGAGSVFGESGEITYTTINEWERCKGTITLTTIGM